MKIVHESIFMNALRAFFVSFFAVLGVIAGFVVLSIGLYALYAGCKEDCFSSNVKLLSDAKGNRKQLSSTTPVILQLTINGEIGKDDLTGEKIQKMLLNSREDNFKGSRVKGILLVINSGGGSVNESANIYNLLKEYKEQYSVPIYAFVNGLCASGGYYIACASDKIFASDVSIVGSIGVLSWPPFLNVYETLEKLGVNTLTLFAGKGKDELNPFRRWENEEQKTTQGLLDYYYRHFALLVANTRSLPLEEITEKMGAEVFVAPEAKKLGLIDVADSSRKEVLQALADSLGLDNYQVVGFETKSWLKTMFKEKSPLFTGRLRHEFALPSYKQSFPVSYTYHPS